MAITWTTDVRRDDWLAARLDPFGGHVGSVIPDGFEAYARLFHPVEDQAQHPTRWRDIARRNGRIAHAEMQLHLVSSPVGTTPALPHQQLPQLSWGSLPPPELAALADLLVTYTEARDDATFAIWDGYGQLHGGLAMRWLATTPHDERVEGTAPSEALTGPRLRLPGREHLLLRGPVPAVTDLHEMVGGQSPNLWWPEDRAWCVATEIDFAWTYVAGSQRLIDEILSDPAFEALPTKPTDRVTADGDLLNAALDHGPGQADAAR